MAIETPNFKLKKPDRTDFVNIKEQLSDNMDIIDEELAKKANKTDIPTSFPADGGNADTVNGHVVNSDVPANAKFTDTVYAHPTTHPASMITGLPTSLPANGGNASTVNGYTVNSNVPAGAKFTDTVYNHPGTHPPTILSAGSLPDTVVAAGPYTDYGVARLRNISAGTWDLTAGSSGLANGTIYIVYE